MDKRNAFLVRESIILLMLITASCLPDIALSENIQTTSKGNRLEYFNSMNGMHYFELYCSNGGKMFFAENEPKYSVLLNNGLYEDMKANKSRYDFADYICHKFGNNPQYQKPNQQ